MRLTFFALVYLTLIVSTRAQAGEKCFDEPTSLGIDRCLSSKLADGEQKLTAAISGMSRKLTKDELIVFRTEQAAWQKYRDLHCRMAGLVFSGGRMESLAQGACRVRLTQARLVDLQDIDVSERVEAH